MAAVISISSAPYNRFMGGSLVAPCRRAVASVVASLSLHLVIGVGAASVFLGATLAPLAPGADPLIVDIIAGEDDGRTAAPPGPRPWRVAAPRALKFSPVSAPALAEPTAALTVETIAAPSAVVIAAAPPEGESTAPALAPPEGESTAPAIASPEASSPAESPWIERVHQGESISLDEAPPDGDAGALADRHLAQREEPTPVPAGRLDSLPGEPSGETGPAAAFSLARVDEVTRNPSLSARAESDVMVARREVFEFLLDHPDFATHITRALRLARYRIWRIDDAMFIDDGWGATGQLTVVHASGGTRVLYARGEFQGKLLPTIPGEAVVTIDYETRSSEDGREVVQARLLGQLKIDNAFAALMLKIASSVAREKAAKESRRLLATFANVLRAIDETPTAVYASVSARPDVPRLELEQFRVLLGLP
jgi:hypothetical protein